MPEILDVNAQTAYAITSATSPKVWRLDRYFATAVFQVTAASGSPVGTFKVSYDDGTTYSDVIVATLGSTLYASGASISLAANDVLLVPCAGATHIKYTRVSGTSATLEMVGVQQPVAGDTGANAQIAAAITTEDATPANADNFIRTGEVRRDTPATSASATGKWGTPNQDANGAHWVSLATLGAGENLTTNRMMVEHAYSLSALMAGDTAVKSGAGFLHTITLMCNDAAPTAGSLIVYDNTAESGTVLFNHTFTTTPFVPLTVLLDVAFATGLYFGFTTTADVNAVASYR